MGAFQMFVFGDAVDRNRINPLDFDNFWVEAGYTSGGSRNQLELPRQANLFFGFLYEIYEEDHNTIGHPELRAGPRIWGDRPLTWHGNNRMERINLPTLRQGGFDYADSLINFNRNDQYFELEVAPVESPTADEWRGASIRGNTIFLIGHRGTGRQCGLF